MQPLTANGDGRATWPPIRIPNDPAIVNLVFYDHSLWMDPPANRLGAVVGFSSSWWIGSGRNPPAARLHASGARTFNLVGYLSPGVGVSVLFQ